MLIILVTILALTFSSVTAQVVYTEPAFPTQNDDITLFFDASKGDAGLENFGGDVYAHMGLITNQSSSPTDWKHVVGNWGTKDQRTLMTKVDDNLYSKSYNISEFHELDSGVLVEQLAFVFRSADGNQAGRAEDGSDIYLDVFPPDDGIFVNLVSPQNNTIVYQQETITINLDLNKLASVIITDNGVEIFNDETDAVDLTIPAEDLGAHVLEFTIIADGDEETLSSNYLVLDRQETSAAIPDWMTGHGSSYDADSDQYGFILTAPNKKHAFLLCPANNFQADVEFKMTRSLAGDAFWTTLPASLFPDGDNLYQYLVDGTIKIADPYSEIVLDPWNDDWVPQDVRELYPDYPTDYTSGIVTVLNLDGPTFNWEHDDFERPQKEELVIYELMMRDFLEDANYKSLLDTISYLKRLGINAIELMPVHEFEGNVSWGYNPSFHYAIDKYYGSEEQLKAVIDECHRLDIAVIFDVVFNHAFSQSPFCQLYWDASNFRPTPENPWLNVTARHPFNVGYDFNHESAYTDYWVRAVLDRLITEFKVDGFRFDLSKGMTQFNSGSNSDLMSQYDQSRIDILSDYADHIWGYDSELYVILEHFAETREEKELSSKGMLLWSNNTFQFAEAAMGYSSDLLAANYKSRGFSEPHIIAYMESHDEERMGYKIEQWGNSSTNYNTKEAVTFGERILATTAVYLSIPGPKMFWQFGELGYDYSINRCEDGSINNDCRLAPKPVRWDYADDYNRRRIYENTAAMLYLRNNYPVFHTNSFNQDDDAYLKRVQLNGQDMNVLTLANFDVVEREIIPEFQHTGEWYDYLSGESISITDVNAPLSFAPGEYHIYLSENISPPNGYFSSTSDLYQKAINIYPNPSPSGSAIIIEHEDLSSVEQLELRTIEGQLVWQRKVEAKDQNQLVIELPEILSQGSYFLYFQDNSGSLTSQLFIIK